MDTSEQYIKMRLTAIPELGRGTARHPYTFWKSGTVFTDEDGNWYHHSNTDGFCKLERQDQLQEMVIHHKRCSIPRWLALDFAYWINDIFAPTDCQVSMEQLWLAFVMKEKYNKVWTGENWVKELNYVET